jgi:hypothetical protein
MTKTTPFFLLSFFFFLQSLGQNQLTVSSFEPTKENWLLLTKDRRFIADNDSLNEHLVDLVKVFSVDSVLPSKSQRHRVAEAGWVISIFGYKWKALSMTKQKFVGTERDGIRVPGWPPHFTEYDVNFNLIPHTRKYIDVLWPAYEQKCAKNRFKRIKNLDEPPCTYPKTLENIDRYRMHCEITPPIDYVFMLNSKFYPCHRPNSSKEHYNIGTDHATFGMYGPFVADYNHTGGPEIHPYDWIWWYDTHPDRLNETGQTWFFGFMKEGSNRFRGWYKKKEPRTGQISVPFLFNTKNDTLKVTLEHLIHDTFNPEAIQQLGSVPAVASDLNFSKRHYSLDAEGLTDRVIKVQTSHPIATEALKAWFSDLNYDKENNILTGYFNLGISVSNLYNAKLSFE